MNAGALSKHERKCRRNPNNRHKCFEYCKHLKMDKCGINKTFECLKTGELMFSYKAEHRGLDFVIKNLVRMPLECNLHEPMTGYKGLDII